MTRETKAGLLMIAMLAGVFGFMVYKRLPPRSAALAQQDVPSADEASSTEEEGETKSNDPFLANVAEQRIPAETKVVPAVATVPAQIPDADGNATNSARPIGNDRRPVRDPFEFDVSRQIPKKLPTPASQEHSHIEKRPTNKGRGALIAVAAETATESPSVATSESAAVPDDFNPFDTAEPEPNGKQDSVGATASNKDLSETDFGPPSRTNSQKLPTEEIALSEKDPFEAESKTAVTFEPPVAHRPGDAEPDPLQQDSGAKDPFADNNLDVQKPQQPSATVESPVLSFEDQPEAAPANTSASSDDSFDQSPKPSEVPTLKIPSAPARPAENDERFGGFRPAAPNQASPEVNPSIPESRAEPARRTTRPAPVTQIDEDFGTRQSARPLIAGETYQVEPNDNYWSISRKKYGTGRYFMALAQHNSKLITDPRRMRPGVIISTPAPEELDRVYSQLIPKPAPTNPVQTASASTATSGFSTGKRIVPVAESGESEVGFFMAKDGAPMYCIGEEDTLSGIAQRHLGRSSRWVQILELNRDVLTDGNTLKIGTVLRLPADASQVDVVGTPRTFR